MRSISTFEEGITDPTITGCFMNPLRNCQSGPPDAPRWNARDLCACSPEKVMPGPEIVLSAACVGKSTPQWQGLPLLPEEHVGPDRPAARALRLAVHGHAGGRLRQYGDAVVDAGDRPRASCRRPLGGGGIQPFLGRLGGIRALLGAPRRPPRPPRPDAARPCRLHPVDA